MAFRDAPQRIAAAHHVHRGTAARAIAAPIDARRGQHDLRRQVDHGGGHAQLRCPSTSGSLPRLFMSRTTMACVLYFLAIDATDSPCLHLVQRNAHALVGAEQIQVAPERVRGIARQQQEVRAGRIRGPAMEAGVELVDFVDGDAGELGGEAQVQLAAGVDAREIRLVRDRAEGDAVVLGIRDQAAHGHEFRHVGARLGGQAQAEEVHGFAGGAVACSLRAARGIRRSCRRRWPAASRRRIRRACTAGSRARRASRRSRRGGRRTTSPA